MDLIYTVLHFVTSLVAAGLFSLGGTTPEIALGKPFTAPSVASKTALFPSAQTILSKVSSTTKPITAKILKKTKESTPLPVSSIPSQATTASTPVTYLPSDIVNDQLRASLVNIICTSQSGTEPISGSGLMVSSRGVVLTNAHVAQFFLLRDYGRPNNIDCIIRTGSPATAKYKAKLLYIPSAWIEANASQIKNGEASGTGEDDYALLLITSRTDGSALPEVFPHVSITIDSPSQDEPVVVAAYPAQFLGGTNILMNLYASSAISTVKQLFTFASGQGPVDAISVGSPINAQSGSSGGGVARLQDGAVEAMISTATEGASTNKRELHAITLAHIDRSLVKYDMGGLVPFLTEGDLSEKATNFNTNVAPKLTRLLTDALK